MNFRGLALAALLLGGCAGQHVSGMVRDAATDRPVAGALVELGNSGWGFRDGQLVWDAEKVSRTTTDADGRFEFDQGGGFRLRIRAAAHPQTDTSLCPRSPMIVRVGGPYAGLRADRRLLLDNRAANELGVSASARGGEDDLALRIEAKGGLRFVEGTGTVPPPPPLPYARAVDLDFGSTCGWLFVSDGTSPVAAIQVAGLGWEQHPGGPRRWVMLYAPLPKG